MNKPLIVGEDNPFDSDPRYALFPYSLASSGGRLCAILGLCEARYLREFDRANLCHGVWSDRVAKATARRLAASPRPAYVLLGEKVCAAFDMEYVPFTVDERPDGATFAVLPHPSGINRIWCRSENVKLARETVETAIRI